MSPWQPGLDESGVYPDNEEYNYPALVTNGK